MPGGLADRLPPAGSRGSTAPAGPDADLLLLELGAEVPATWPRRSRPGGPRAARRWPCVRPATRRRCRRGGRRRRRHADHPARRGRAAPAPGAAGGHGRAGGGAPAPRRPVRTLSRQGQGPTGTRPAGLGPASRGRAARRSPTRSRSRWLPPFRRPSWSTSRRRHRSRPCCSAGPWTCCWSRGPSRSRPRSRRWTAPEAWRRCCWRRMPGRPACAELPPQIDLLQLPVPTLLARQRLALALRIGGAAPLAARTAAGRLGAAAARRPDRALQSGRLPRLSARGGRTTPPWWRSSSTGWTSSTRWPATPPATARWPSSAHSCGGHCGQRISRRIWAAAASPWPSPGRPGSSSSGCGAGSSCEVGDGLLAGAEALPVRGAPAQRLARLFGDLRRLRPAA